jgi:hypothetical protein
VGLALVAEACGPTVDDVHRWEGTLHGPDKLAALVASDNATWALREEAALALIRLKPRLHRSVGLELLVAGRDSEQGTEPGVLFKVGDPALAHLVQDLAPALVQGLTQPRPPRGASEDPTIPYKAFAFHLLSHQPPPPLDDKTRADLTDALTHWVQADFLDGRGGTEDGIIHLLGAPAVRHFPEAITAESGDPDAASRFIAAVGDADTKTRASEALVALARYIDSPAWLEKRRALIVESNARVSSIPPPRNSTWTLATTKRRSSIKSSPT